MYTVPSKHQIQSSGPDHQFDNPVYGTGLGDSTYKMPIVTLALLMQWRSQGMAECGWCHTNWMDLNIELALSLIKFSNSTLCYSLFKHIGHSLMYMEVYGHRPFIVLDGSRKSCTCVMSDQCIYNNNIVLVNTQKCVASSIGH